MPDDVPRESRLPAGWVPVTDGMYDTESGNYLLFGKDGGIVAPYRGWMKDTNKDWLLARKASATSADFFGQGVRP